MPYAPTINSCNHLIISDINRRAVTASITPYWRRRRLCGDLKAPKKTSTAARLQTQLLCVIRVFLRRCLTMLNRWQAHRAQPAESVLPEICASKWHNIVRHLRRRRSDVSAPPQVPLTLHQRLSIVCHLRRHHRISYYLLNLCESNTLFLRYSWGVKLARRGRGW